MVWKKYFTYTHFFFHLNGWLPYVSSIWSMDQNTCVAGNHCILTYLCFTPSAFFQMYCHFAEENLYMKSPKTVTNWTTGKVLAPHSCLPATVSTTGDTDASTLHAHQSTATLEPGCSGRVALWMSFSFFLKWDSPRGQAENVIRPKLEEIYQMWF